jgi:hypothetical protein
MQMCGASLNLIYRIVFAAYVIKNIDFALLFLLLLRNTGN